MMKKTNSTFWEFEVTGKSLNKTKTLSERLSHKAKQLKRQDFAKIRKKCQKNGVMKNGVVLKQ